MGRLSGAVPRIELVGSRGEAVPFLHSQFLLGSHAWRTTRNAPISGYKESEES